MIHRVLHVTQPTTGGVERAVIEMAEYSSDEWEVHVACPAEGSLTRRIQREVPTHHWPAQRAPHRGVLREALGLRRIVREVNPDLVHLHSAKAGLIGRLVLRGRVPTIYQPHAWSFLALPRIARVVAVWWERLAARWTTAVVCVSEQEALLGVSAAIRCPIRVIPNVAAVTTCTEADRTLDQTSGGAVVVCIGRLCRQKGQDLLLRAWAQVAGDNDRLLLIGDGPTRTRLEALGTRGVEFVGFDATPDRFVRAADLVVVPSRWDGMSFVLLDAVAAGRCVVATDVGGAREVVASTDALVPPGDVVALAEALRARLNDPVLRRAEADANRGRTADLGDRVRHRSVLLALYREAVAS